MSDDLKRLFAIADDALAAGIAVMPAAVWVKDDGTVGKAPLSAHGHLDAHHDRLLIRQQLAGPPHVPQGVPDDFEVVVAIVPGSGGFLLLDCDVKAGKAGQQSLSDLEAEHGGFITSVWTTPSGGANVLLRKPPGADYGNHSPWRGIDVRADGGWVVAPGNSCAGGDWMWWPGCGYDTASLLPAGMATLLKAPSQAGRRATSAETVRFIEESPKTTTMPVMQAFSTELDYFQGSAKGSRHEALVRIVSWSFGMHALDLRWAMAKIKAEWLQLTASEGREDEVDVIACWVAGQESTRRAEADTDESDDGMVPLIDWTEVHDPEDDVVEGLVMYGRWLQFVAPAKEGKSSLEVWMAIELSEGRDPFDGTPITPVRVLYCLGEMWRPDLEELIRACGHDPLKLANLHATEMRMRLDTEAGAARLLRRVDQLGPQVVILDGLNGFINPEASENDDKTWRPFVDYTADPLRQRSIALVSADNMGKDPKLGSRGSSVKNDKADGVVAVRRTDKGAKLHVTHSRAGAYLTGDLALDAEGFDRSRPIRYWRAIGSWPAGTAAAATMLDSLGVPIDESRRKVRARLRSEIATAEAAGDDADRFRVATDTLRAALRYRHTPVIKPSK